MGAINHILTIKTLYPEIEDFTDLEDQYDKPGRKINNYIQFVEANWNTEHRAPSTWNPGPLLVSAIYSE